MAAEDRTPRKHDFFFSPRDYLNDPAVLAMSTLARGAYSTLLFALWDQPEPGVCEAHTLTLMALSRTTAREWKTVRGSVEGAFDTLSRPGCWVQKRMVREHQRQTDYYDKARKLGRIGGLKSASTRDMARDPQGTLKADHKGASTASPASSASPASPAVDSPPHPPPRAPREVGPSANGRNPDHTPIPPWLPPALWADWCTYRRACRNAPWTLKAASLSVSRLTSLRDDGQDPRAVIEQSILNGWRGLFAVKPDSNGKTTDDHAPEESSEARMARWRREGILP